MMSLYKRFKELSGKRGADLAEENNFTRQYISLLVNNPTDTNNRRLSFMMLESIDKTIDKETEEHEARVKKLIGMRNEIVFEMTKKKEVSA